ncbi:MAG: LysM peptidoglycan-binding domain-containing protein [Rhodospirillales bacterium]|nr:MAG: LysM peptidoglycan-binding domain-containing protein [Rhodospirillales bacterium]
MIAGRGEPGARVVVLDGDKELATVEIDSRGEWVALVNDPPLAPGAHELRLVIRKDGAEVARSDRTVAIVVPKPAADAAPPLVVSTPVASGPSTVLQAPGGRDSLARSGDLVLGAVDYDGRGRATISGQAAPGAAVRVYLGDKPVGEAVAGADGKWEVRPAETLPVGRQALRLDRLGPGGTVASRLEVPFERVDLPSGGSVTIARGDNLWNIARARLGDGPRYTAIYEANRGQIRDPDLIYPGQVFVIPKAP